MLVFTPPPHFRNKLEFGPSATKRNVWIRFLSILLLNSKHGRQHHPSNLLTLCWSVSYIRERNITPFMPAFWYPMLPHCIIFLKQPSVLYMSQSINLARIRHKTATDTTSWCQWTQNVATLGAVFHRGIQRPWCKTPRTPVDVTLTKTYNVILV